MVNGMKEVTDPKILQLLNQSNGKQESVRPPGYYPVTNPETIQQLEGKGFSGKNMVHNIAPNTADIVKGGYEAATHPIDTTQGIGSLIAGFGEKIQGMVNSMMPKEGKLRELSDFTSMFYRAMLNTALGKDFDESNIPTADAFTQHYVDKYGSVDKALASIEKEPVSALLDVLSIGTLGASGAVKTKALMGKVVPKSLPKHMYESAAKFTTTRKKGDVNTQALLDEGVALTPEGVTKLKTTINKINQEIDTIINNSPNANTRVPTDFIFNRINGLKNKYMNTVEGVKDRAIIEKIVDAYKEEIAVTGSDFMTIKQLNDWKKNTYGKVTDWSPVKGNKRKTKDETFKALSGGARDIVESMEPTTKALNQRQAPLLASREQLERAVSRIENRDTIGMGDLVKMGVGGGAGAGVGSMLDIAGMGGLGTGIGAIAAILGRPTTKSKIAIGLNNLKKGKSVDEYSDLAKALMKAGYGNLALQASESYDLPPDMLNKNYR